MLFLGGTIFSGGLIHIFCSSEYFQQDSVCLGLSPNKLQCMCVHGEETCHPVQQCDSLMCFNNNNGALWPLDTNNYVFHWICSSSFFLLFILQ